MHRILLSMDVQENFQEFLFLVEVFQLRCPINLDERNLKTEQFLFFVKNSPRLPSSQSTSHGFQSLESKQEEKKISKKKLCLNK